MLEMCPNCECCDVDLPPDTRAGRALAVRPVSEKRLVKLEGCDAAA